MVLTEEKVAYRNVTENFDGRQCSETLLAQTLCDREIQRSLGHKETTVKVQVGSFSFFYLYTHWLINICNFVETV